MIRGYSPKYNPLKDIQKVSPIGSLNLREAFANSSIPANLMSEEGNFNEIDNPDAIQTRVRNKIDAEVLDSAVRAYKPESNDPDPSDG